MLLPFPYIYSRHPAAYEVPNDNIIAKLAAGYEGKKPGSGSVRGSVQEFAADKACDTALKAAGEKYGNCVVQKANSAGHLKEAVAWGNCLKTVTTIEGWAACDAAQPALAPSMKKCEKELANSDELVKVKAAAEKYGNCVVQKAISAGHLMEAVAWGNCMKKATTIEDWAACDAAQPALAPSRKECENELCASPSSFMALMGSVEVFDSLPFEAMAFEGKRFYALG